MWNPYAIDWDVDRDYFGYDRFKLLDKLWKHKDLSLEEFMIHIRMLKEDILSICQPLNKWEDCDLAIAWMRAIRLNPRYTENYYGFDYQDYLQRYYRTEWGNVGLEDWPKVMTDMPFAPEDYLFGSEKWEGPLFDADEKLFGIEAWLSTEIYPGDRYSLDGFWSYYGMLRFPGSFISDKALDALIAQKKEELKRPKIDYTQTTQ